LYIASALYLKGPDGLDGGVAQPLMVHIAERLCGSYYYGLPGMDAHGIKVLHVADDDAVVLGIPHDLVLELLPAQDRLLDQHLVDPRVDEPTPGDVDELLLVVGDAPARASQRVRRADEDRIASQLLGRGQGLLDAVHGPALGDRLTYLEHHLPEELPVLGQGDGMGLRPQQLYAQAVQGTVLRELGAYIEGGLTTHA